VGNELFKTKDRVVDGEYIAQQVVAGKASAWWKQHKAGINRFDSAYAGNLSGLVAESEDNTLPADEPYVENKLKNSAHDIKRLAREARGFARFTKEGEDDESGKRAKLRGAATETMWVEGGGARVEGQFYFDLIRGGFAAVAGYKKDGCDYPQAMRLDPLYAYPTVANGELLDVLYIETMKERVAAALFDLEGLDPKSDKNVDVIMYFDKTVVCQAVVQSTEDGKGLKAALTSEWKHGLKCVPVAFRALETADGRFHGLLDQLAGPLKARNRAMRLMVDYLDDLVHTPWEEKGILNGPSTGNLPGPTTTYKHDDDYEGDTFVRRTQPAAPAAQVFGLLNYLDIQEQNEGFQPATRTGSVRQSQASGSFVQSTQGSLSSVVLELQGYIADLRHDWNVVAIKIAEKHLNKEVPLIRAVGQKTTYKPKELFNGWYYHQVSFGVAAGLDRQTADQRLLQFMGAGVIDDGIVRDQVDFIENDTNIQDDVDRMVLRKVMMQKLLSDPNVPFSALAQIEQEMGKGKSRYEALKAILPELLKREEEARAAGLEAALGPQGPGAPAEGQDPAAEALALQKGAAPGADALELGDFAPPPFTEIIAS
jgi:hypothetical protein